MDNSSVEYSVHYSELFMQKACMHIIQFYLYKFEEDFNAKSFAFRLTRVANDRFNDELKKGKSEEQALKIALKLFDKKIIIA